jgi:hypothetical protein
MANIKDKFNKVVESTHKKLMGNGQILPVKTDAGILVGSVLIVSQGTVKHLYENNQLIFSNISLNIVAIKMANLISLKQSWSVINELYRLDQVYGNNYVEMMHFKSHYDKSLAKKDLDKAEIFWARYQETKDRALSAKKKAERLC